MSRLEKFAKNEDGGILILSLLLFVAMIVAGGLAVDLSNHERTRIYLQSHLDNAVLAAASLSQELDPKDTVMSYMSSAGLDPSEVDVKTSIEEIGGILVGRTVEASIDGGVDTYFFRFFDIDKLGMTIASQATERVEDIEISLVLDVSGSMKDPARDGSGKKLDLLKGAANDFVDAVLSEAEEGRVSISIIPYSTKVNAGAELLQYYNVTSEHDYSHCVDFDAADYTQLSIDPSDRLQRTGHFQFQRWDRDDMKEGEWTCRIDDGFHITPLSSSADALKAQINRLTGEGSTSIDVGAKWGLALLDPSARQAVDGLISEGIVSSDFYGRPHPHKSQNNMKVLVIMTDGENATEFRLRSEYASGPSNVIRTESPYYSSTFYSVESGESWGKGDNAWPHDETYYYAIHPFKQNPYWDNDTIIDNPAFSSYAHLFTERRLTWPELWADMSPHYYGHNLLGKQYQSWRYWDNEMYKQWNRMHWYIDYQEKDTRALNICSAAKSAGIVTYTIGMDVKLDRSLNLLKQCASTEAHYFDVGGLEINNAFEMIAASISMLRLTK